MRFEYNGSYADLLLDHSSEVFAQNIWKEADCRGVCQFARCGKVRDGVGEFRVFLCVSAAGTGV